MWAQEKHINTEARFFPGNLIPPLPFLCIPGWERCFMGETEGTHKMRFKVAISGVSVTSPCPLRPSQAGFLIRAMGRSSSGLRWPWRQLLLQARKAPLNVPGGPLTLGPQSLSSTDLMGQNMSFRLKQNFWTWEPIYFLPEKAHLKWPSTVSFIHSFFIHICQWPILLNRVYVTYLKKKKNRTLFRFVSIFAKMIFKGDERWYKETTAKTQP